MFRSTVWRDGGRHYQVHDLLNDARYIWRGRRNYVELDPEMQPAHIFRVRRVAGAAENSLFNAASRWLGV